MTTAWLLLHLASKVQTTFLQGIPIPTLDVRLWTLSLILSLAATAFVAIPALLLSWRVEAATMLKGAEIPKSCDVYGGPSAANSKTSTPISSSLPASRS